MRIVLNKPAADALVAKAREGVERLADVAGKLERETADLRSAVETNDEVAKASARTFRLWSAVAWADLLRRFTGR